VPETEIGYSLDDPGGAGEVLSSGKRHPLQELSVSIGVGLSGAWGEVLVDPSQAIEFADWLDDQIASLWDGEGQ
jgi:hypothetical protein